MAATVCAFNNLFFKTSSASLSSTYLSLKGEEKLRQGLVNKLRMGGVVTEFPHSCNCLLNLQTLRKQRINDGTEMDSLFLVDWKKVNISFGSHLRCPFLF